MSYHVRIVRRGGALPLEGPFKTRYAARVRMFGRVECEPVGVRHDTVCELVEGEAVLEDYTWMDLASPEARNRRWGFRHRTFSKEESLP